MSNKLNDPMYYLELLKKKYDVHYKAKDLTKTNCLYLVEQMNGRGKKNDWYAGKTINSAIQRLYQHLTKQSDCIKQNMELNNTKRIRLYVIDYNITSSDELADKEKKLIDKLFAEDKKRTINRDFRGCPKALENLSNQGYTKQIHKNRLGIVQYI